jgi:hypothetical protein
VHGREKSQIPSHLKPLVETTPSGVMKLLAAWDGLSTETQIQILDWLERAGLPEYMEQRVRLKALESSNSYVRYLSAVGFRFNEDDPEGMKAVRRCIEDDPDSLVRYAPLEHQFRIGQKYLLDRNEFFALPQAARLALVRRMRRFGETVAALVSHAWHNLLGSGSVTEKDLFEILCDYVNREEFKEQFRDTCPKYDYLSQQHEEKDFEALWRLVKLLPESVAQPLVEHLPTEVRTHLQIPQDILDSMNDRQLETLLARKDVFMWRFRKKLFFEPDHEREMVRSAAAFFNFSLDLREFADVLSKPEPERTSLLTALTYADDLSLCVHDAVQDALWETDAWEFADRDRTRIKHRLRQLQGGQRDEEILELQLYRLARRYVPWKRSEEVSEPTGDWEFLRSAIVEGDTWRTFMGVCARWSLDKNAREKVRQFLPHIPEANLDDQADKHE